MKPAYTLTAEQATPPYSVANTTIYVAFRLASKFQQRLPTIQELMTDFNMSRATAYRWLGAMKAARGEHA